jgi:hypothetical protein
MQIKDFVMTTKLVLVFGKKKRRWRGERDISVGRMKYFSPDVVYLYSFIRKWTINPSNPTGE